MTIAAHQPNYLPNLAFFNKMKLSDLFVVITNIQFSKHEGWQQRHKIVNQNKDMWLTVPVFGSQNQKIKQVIINNQLSWRKKHQRTMEIVYAKSKGNKFIPTISSIYQKSWNRLVDLNFTLITAFREILGIKTKVILDEDVYGVKHTLLMNICKKYGGRVYLSGVGAKTYLDKDRLRDIKRSGIDHRFVKKNLTALYPYSTLHYLLTNGKEWVTNVIS